MKVLLKSRAKNVVNINKMPLDDSFCINSSISFILSEVWHAPLVGFYSWFLLFIKRSLVYVDFLVSRILAIPNIICINVSDYQWP